MLALIAIGLVGGLITGLSPCILPVLPAIFVAGSARPQRVSTASVGHGDTLTVERTTWLRTNARPIAVVLGLVVSFSIFTLLGSALLRLLHLPDDLLRVVGLLVLAAAGLGLLIPAFGEVLERPFSRLPQRAVNRDGSAFVLGLGLGLVFVPCAGPVLAAITVVSASGTIGWQVVVLTVAFAIGVAIPLLAFALAGDRIGARSKAFRTHAPMVRRIGGIILLATSVLLAFNVTDRVQRLIPGYTAALTGSIESNPTVREKLAGLSSASTGSGALTNCADGASTLASCGAAPEFAGIKQWLNTKDGAPLTIAGLKGKVVLVDFWTYSCINCQRTLPYLQAWNKAYSDKGLVIVGVHTPEFAFERVAGNVQSNARDLGVTWPVALDNDFDTWNAYSNQYWPAHYLIDTTGTVRQVHFGEGAYAETEELIRQLLPQKNVVTGAPASSSVADQTPSGHSQTPESYLGYRRISNFANPQLLKDTVTNYVAPERIPNDAFAFAGQWTIGEDQATAGSKASLALNFSGQKVYLVLGGEGPVTVSVDGRTIKTVKVKGPPTLYELYSARQPSFGLMTLTFTPGVQAYAFTFG